MKLTYKKWESHLKEFFISLLLFMILHMVRGRRKTISTPSAMQFYIEMLRIVFWATYA